MSSSKRRSIYARAPRRGGGCCGSGACGPSRFFSLQRAAGAQIVPGACPRPLLGGAARRGLGVGGARGVAALGVGAALGLGVETLQGKGTRPAELALAQTTQSALAVVARLAVGGDANGRFGGSGSAVADRSFATVSVGLAKVAAPAADHGGSRIFQAAPVGVVRAVGVARTRRAGVAGPVPAGPRRDDGRARDLLAANPKSVGAREIATAEVLRCLAVEGHGRILDALAARVAFACDRGLGRRALVIAR